MTSSAYVPMDSPTGGASRAVELPEVISFAALFRREYHGLVSLAWGLTGSRETAEDIAQDSLLSLHRRWGQGNQIANPAAYLRRTCANLSVSWIRRRMAETRALLRHGAPATNYEMPAQEAELFWSEVRRLPRRQAQTVALYYGYDLTVTEVSEILELSVGSTKTHLHRARRALAARLRTDFEAEDGDENVT